MKTLKCILRDTDKPVEIMYPQKGELWRFFTSDNPLQTLGFALISKSASDGFSYRVWNPAGNESIFHGSVTHRGNEFSKTTRSWIQQVLCLEHDCEITLKPLSEKEELLIVIRDTYYVSGRRLQEGISTMCWECVTGR